MKKLSHELLKHKQAGLKGEIEGRYYFRHPKIKGYLICVIASDGLGWDHVSVSLQDHRIPKKPKAVERCPNWEEMCFVKDIFFEESETVIQYHPPKESYVNTHPFCLHLWKNQNIDIEVPERILVGV
jgi:hypothetical protein